MDILRLARPEALLAGAALLIMAVDFLVLRRQPQWIRMGLLSWLAALSCAAAIVLMAYYPAFGRLPGGMMTINWTTQLVKMGLLLLSLFTILISADTDFTEHVGEYFALILFATIGMTLLASAENLLMLFVALELSSLSLYILAAFNKQDANSAEAALKYFLFGGVAAAFMLFGISLLYGACGTLQLSELSARLNGHGTDLLAITALVMIVIGFGFKVAAVPFHLWAPDAYQGAPTPSAALIASGSKLAGFFILGKFMMAGFSSMKGSAAWQDFATGWVPLLALLALLSMVLGNLAAIVQSNVRRLLAFSAIAHGGYTLIALLSNSPEGMAAVIFYMIVYGLTVIGAFGVVACVERETGGATMADFAGLARRSPVLAVCLLIFFLSLAGIPPLGGFFGKCYLFLAALKHPGNSLDLLWLVAVAIATSTISLYYYLQVLKHAFVSPPPQSTASPNANAQVPPAQSTAVWSIVLLAFAVLAIGCFPQWLLNLILTSLRFG
jgi:NADH-quinone oxidoreductase subunit N